MCRCKCRRKGCRRVDVGAVVDERLCGHLVGTCFARKIVAAQEIVRFVMMVRVIDVLDRCFQTFGNSVPVFPQAKSPSLPDVSRAGGEAFDALIVDEPRIEPFFQAVRLVVLLAFRLETFFDDVHARKRDVERINFLVGLWRAGEQAVVWPLPGVGF